jgi:branched-chain amino acid transport system ATP-binding protein
MTPLEVTGLSKSFGGVTAVHDVSFSLRPNELLAMIGPNGAGKSTCFNMLNGQLRPDAGRITLFGQEIVGLKPRQVWRLGVGRTFQITATFAVDDGDRERADDARVPSQAAARHGALHGRPLPRRGP